MPLTLLDLILLGVMLLSALLAMVRGFTREVLSIASWGTAIGAALYFHPQVMPYISSYFQREILAKGAAMAIVFFAVLIVVSIITIKISDMILDSRIGALDRSLGFVFGAGRGFLLVVVAFLFLNWLIKTPPDWIAQAQSRTLLERTGTTMMAILPEDPEETILKRFKLDRPAPGDGDTPEGEGEAPAAPPATAPARRP